MSQGESAPRPTSRHSSSSPARAADAASSPPLRQSRAHQDDPRTLPLHDSGGVAVTEGDGRAPPSGSTNSGLLDMSAPDHIRLHHISYYEQSLPRQQQHPLTGRNPQPAMGAVQTQGAATPRTTNPTLPPTTSSPAAPPVPTGRATPPDIHPYPLAARRILTPKSPRTASLSRAAQRTVDAQHLTASLQAPAPRGPVPTHDPQALGGGHAPLGGHAQFYGPVPGYGTIAPSPTRPTSGLARSLSHPGLGHGLHSAAPQEALQQLGGVKREHSGQPVLLGPSFAAPVPPNRTFGTPEPFGDGRWGHGNRGSLAAGSAMVRNLQVTEGQPVLAIKPENGEEIYVTVDLHQGSKQADEKRQRNASASSRFRKKKKLQEKSKDESLQKLELHAHELEKKNEELVKRCQELEDHRDFYRNERNRLRDVVSRTPSIKEWADRGPPSPILRSGGSFTSDVNALLAHPPSRPPSHAHSQSQPHTPQFPQPLPHPHPRSISFPDPSVPGPPARRRRTDSEPQLPSTSYSSMTPTSLPPISGPSPSAFSLAPSPHITPPPGSTRLPPLRFDQSRPSSTTPPPVASGPPPPSIPPQSAGQYSTFRFPYESGWATDPRGPAGGGPK